MGMYIAGIDIGGTNLKFGIFNERGIRLYMRVLRSVPGQPEATAQQIADVTAIINSIEESPELKAMWDKYRKQFAYAASIEYGQIINVLKTLLE